MISKVTHRALGNECSVDFLGSLAPTKRFGLVTMLVTVIRERFRFDERANIAAALEEICSPNDNIGWASAGVYCFWNTRTGQPLYLGLARYLG